MSHTLPAQFDKATADRIYHLADVAPAELSDQFIEYVEVFCSREGADIMRRNRARALDARAKAEPAAVTTKAAASPATDTAPIPTDWASAVKLYPTRKVTLEMFDGLMRVAADLMKRVKALEARPELKHCGVWESGQSYRKGSLVQHQGSCWLAREDTTAVPGAPDLASRTWVLVAKAGRNGKDGKDAAK